MMRRLVEYRPLTTAWVLGGSAGTVIATLILRSL